MLGSVFPSRSYMYFTELQIWGASRLSIFLNFSMNGFYIFLISPMKTYVVGTLDKRGIQVSIFLIPPWIVLIFFLFLMKKYMLWVLIISPRWGASNEYPQCLFSWRNKENIYLIPPLIWSYAFPANRPWNCIQLIFELNEMSRHNLGIWSEWKIKSSFLEYTLYSS